ncbi:Crp/Fnr family transcriptional regulator, partial [Glutamicibacter creatinolyticus]
FGTPSRQGELIQFPLSRADLAGITGASPESVSRAMSSLRKAGIIETGRRWTALTDRARLTEIAENY